MQDTMAKGHVEVYVHIVDVATEKVSAICAAECCDDLSMHVAVVMSAGGWMDGCKPGKKKDDCVRLAALANLWRGDRLGRTHAVDKEVICCRWHAWC